LSWGCRLQTQAPSGGLEFVRRNCPISFQLESIVFFDQFLAFSAQVFALITKLHGGKVLLGREDKTTGED
jgi:hypothetical protein